MMADLDFPDVQPEMEEDTVGTGQGKASTAPAEAAPPKREDFAVLKYLGEGSVGAVMQVKHKETGDIYALKAVDKKRIEEHDLGERLLVEARVQMKVMHPNLLRCHNCFEDRGSIYLLLEYAEGGDLHRLIKSRGRLNEPDTAYVFSQVVEGVQYLHNRGIIHRDLKAENILLDEELGVKVADFGWCAEVEGRTTFCGTPCMLAPEMIQGKPYDRSVDIWSVGVLLFEMLCGSSPFDRGGGLLETCQNIVVVGLEDAQLNKTPVATHPLLQGLLHKDAESRMSLERALRHHWVVEKRAMRMGIPSILEGDEEEDDAAEEPTMNAEHFFMGTGPNISEVEPFSIGALGTSSHDVSWAIPPTHLISNVPPTNADCMHSTVQSIDVLPSPMNSLSPPSTSKASPDIVPPLIPEHRPVPKNLATEDLENTFPEDANRNGYDSKLIEKVESPDRLQGLDSSGSYHHQVGDRQRQANPDVGKQEQPRVAKLLSLESSDSTRAQDTRAERLPPVTSALPTAAALDAGAKIGEKVQPARVERLQSLDLTPPSSPRRQASGELDNSRGGYLMSFCSSGNLSQYRPGSTQGLLLPSELPAPAIDPVFNLTSPVVDSLPGRAPAHQEANRSKLEILGRGVGCRQNPESPSLLERLPGSPFSIERAAQERESAKQVSDRRGSSSDSGYGLPSTSRDLPRAKAPSPATGGYRGKQQTPASPVREVPRPDGRQDLSRDQTDASRINGSRSSGGFQESRDVRQNDGFMESDAWMRQQQAESIEQSSDNLLDKAMRFVGLQAPDPNDELHRHVDKFGTQQFELLHQLITLGFDERLSVEAVRRASSVEAAVDWMLKNS